MFQSGIVKTLREGAIGATKPLSLAGYGVCSEAIENYGACKQVRNDTSIEAGGYLGS